MRVTVSACAASAAFMRPTASRHSRVSASIGTTPQEMSSQINIFPLSASLSRPDAGKREALQMPEAAGGQIERFALAGENFRVPQGVFCLRVCCFSLIRAADDQNHTVPP